jgi:hypothetical protein
VAQASEKQGYRRTWIDHTSELAASAETVSALLSDMDGWPSWTPGLSAIRRKKSPLAVGSKFGMVLRMKGTPPVYLPCEVTQLSPKVIEWGGGLGSSVIRHRFEIEAVGPTRCRVRHLEYATGVLALLARPIEKLAYAHDLGWSKAIERRFAG